MRFVNLTPHAINVMHDSGHVVTIQPDGTVARVSMAGMHVANIGGFDISRQSPGPVVGLPAPTDGVMWIVSAMVRTACPDRLDVVSPGDLVRNDAGVIVGCRNFVCN